MQTLLSNHNFLKEGELYLFHPFDPQCPAEDSLWGVVDGRQGHTLLLESVTRNHRIFLFNQPLPANYRYARLADRSELRDYAYNLAWSDRVRYYARPTFVGPNRDRPNPKSKNSTSATTDNG